MLYPSINVLREKVDSKYTLVMLASKRARDLIDKLPPLVHTDIDKPISIATEEIAEDLITYSRDFTTEEEALRREKLQRSRDIGFIDVGSDIQDALMEDER